MILSHSLSTLKCDTRDPYEIIPISFNMQELLHAKYYIHMKPNKNYILLRQDLKPRLVVRSCLKKMVYTKVWILI